MTLKELADLLELSPTTVSRALNGYSDVSESTRARVLKKAAELNYRPNARAMGLATGRAMAIGHIIPVATRNDVVNPVFGEFIAGASHIYSQMGYELLLKVVESKDETDIYRDLHAKGVVDGVIVHSPSRKDSRIPLLKEIGLPFVIHGRSDFPNDDYAWIDVDNRSAFRKATRLLLDLGHRHIALLNGQEALNFAWLRKQGYLDALAERDVQAQPSLMRSGEMTEPFGFMQTKELLQSNPAPTAFLVSSYVLALGVRRALGQSGKKIGKDVSVIIHDDELSYFHNGGEEPQFTATRSSVRKAGEKAAEMLIQMINQPEHGPTHCLLQAHLTIGASTGPCHCNQF